MKEKNDEVKKKAGKTGKNAVELINEIVDRAHDFAEDKLDKLESKFNDLTVD